ncbi:hypothetical protein QQP08_019731, partial [Theobroma cacao]
MGNGERVSHAGEAGHMLKQSDKNLRNFACALALQLGPSPLLRTRPQTCSSFVPLPCLLKDATSSSVQSSQRK